MQRSSLTFEQGDIAIAAVRFSDGSGVKRRPVLVISKRSDSMLDVLAIKITTTARNSKYCIALLPGDIEEGRLKSKSHISADFIVTIQKNLITQKAGRLKSSKLNEIKGKLRELLDL